MRRALVIAVLVVVALVTAVSAVGAAPTKTKTVTGSFNGAGGYVFDDSSCTASSIASAGTYRAKHLGRGTYAFRVCLTVDDAFHAAGTFELVTRAAAQLHGAIDTDVTNGLHGLPVTITGGTARFAAATGTLVLDFVMFNEHNCTRNNICLSWDERGTITGTITPRP